MLSGFRRSSDKAAWIWHYEQKTYQAFFNFDTRVSETTQQDSINLEPEWVNSIPKVLSEFNFGSY